MKKNGPVHIFSVTGSFLRLFFTAGILILYGLIYHTPVSAQEETIRKEVRVVKPYEPVLEKAQKINLLPVLDDTVRFRPDFTYSISPRPFLAVYQARPIRAARLEGESIPKLYKSYLKLGFGNYISPMGEFSMNNLRSKDHNLGLYLGHISSQGKLKLENGKKVQAPYAESLGKVYGQKYFDHSTFEGNAFVRSDKVAKYGYFSPVDTVLSKDSVSQQYLNPGIGLRYHSSWPDSGHLNYDLNGKYDYFSVREGDQQHAIRFIGSMDKQFDDKTIGVATRVRYFRQTVASATGENTVVSLQPWFSQSTAEWRLKAALDATFDTRNGNTEVRLYPKIRFQFNIVPEFVTAYIGMDGGLQIHDLMSLARENPYLSSGFPLYNTDRKMEVYGSIFGQAGTESDYRLFGSFTLADKMPFFVNDSSNGLGNNFTVVYDDVQIVKFSGEYTFRLDDKWMVSARAASYRYTMSTLQKPWHKPGFDAGLRIGYNLRNKIMIRTDLFYVGNRYAVSLDRPNDIVQLSGYPDINLELEYRYTKILSFFVRFNNLAGIRYQQWNQYPVQQFRFTGGFTYSL